MEADSLAPNVWNAITEAIARSVSPTEITVGLVTKRDVTNRIIWLDEFGETAIPMVAFDRSFAYYDTQADGTTKKREDISDNDPAFRAKALVPRVGEQVVVLNKWGHGRFPICLGVIQSKAGTYWQGES